jgi:hypothetical protein
VTRTVGRQLSWHQDVYVGQELRATIDLTYWDPVLKLQCAGLRTEEAVPNGAASYLTRVAGSVAGELFMSRWLFALTGIAGGVICLPGIARADGLIYQLPEDGTWVRYEYENRRVDEKGAVQSKQTGSVALSSVGRETVNGETCRWIEMKTHIIRDGKPDYIELFKLLIPEKRLKAGEDPLSDVVRGWYKYGGVTIQRTGRVLDYTTETPNRVMTPSVHGMSGTLSTFIAAPLKASQKLDEEVVDSKLGKRPCPGVACTSTTKIDRGKDPRTIISNLEMRSHEDVPFGVISFREDVEVRRDEKFGSRSITTLKLADFGTGARSDIPDER